jgi:hypothetical protein
MGKTTLPAILFLSAVAGCGGGGGTRATFGIGCRGGQDGILLLSWSLACTRVDHMALDLSSQGCGVEIEPIPCKLDRFRYDHLPEGPGIVTIVAVDADGYTLQSGSAMVDLTTALPPSPTPVTLR